MAPTDRFVIAFSAEPPQDELPYGRWADRLRVEFLAACLRIDDEGEDLGQAGDVTWYPDRTYGGRTYVPATARTSIAWVPVWRTIPRRAVLWQSRRQIWSTLLGLTPACSCWRATPIPIHTT